MSKIKSLIAREIKDSRGNPSVEAVLETEKGEFSASVPSGASTGKNEALELRDADGKGVLKAIENVNKIIAPKLKGKNPENQQEIDKIMIESDGTENKSKLGANAILAVSLAVCRAGAASKKSPLYQHIADLADVRHPTFVGCRTYHKLPLAMFNILEGGAHAKNELAIQEFMIVPCLPAGGRKNKSFAENLVLCNKVFQNLNNILTKNYPSAPLDLARGRSSGQAEMGDEGGFAPQISKTEQALFLLRNAIGQEDCKIAIDCAASQFYQNGKYKIDGQEFTAVGLSEFYEGLVKTFPIISIEDPFAEEDWNGFELIVRQLGNKISIVGDDLTTTNIKRIKEAHNKNACNGVILKLNQIGTVSETIEASILAKSFGWKTIVSHRSGETSDSFIADLAVGLSTDFIKSGSPAKEERMVKYKRLLEIEQELYR
ncbi:MAG: phosphopyruvate hydratase [Candidatus Staskawiczbacteria bacterium RIFCSPLOWO2_12_FULL_37_15]|uniref:Enolase n=1 Tax=Candidatus Staskawiczbacteria bacterium RIFCSPLOWO2_12_FULL_37_15 TaxID=1802218 RepID=A0A1G2IKU3_9BACT|nr:MAG: phosphopyruvate hydratase [Candidatus Staskawiczbacteria bacterium RIFCSPLOWO2_12_FULL_37_15]